MIEIVRKRVEESISVKQKILADESLLETLVDISVQIVSTLNKGGKVIFAGNGGSFADSIHLAAEFVSRFQKEREALAAIALGANNSTLTAIGNDYSFEEVFSRELEALAGADDLFIAISTSGNSKNILRAVQSAERKGIVTYCLTGEGGGELASLTRTIEMPATKTARIQEGHILVGHIICELAENAFTEG